jgi:replicative DNA helicase
MSGSSRNRNDTREYEVSTYSRELKGLAKDIDVPVIALSQLSRKPEDRPNKRPQLADLRESGGLENNADEVAFIYRHAYYLRMAHQPVPAEDEHMAEIIIAKARSGRTGVAAVRFEERFTRFENLVQEAY